MFLIFIIGGYFLIQDKQAVRITSSIEAVPINTSLIIKIHSVQRFMFNLENDTAIWRNLRDLEIFTNFNQHINFFKTKITEVEHLKYFIQNKSILISVHLQGKDKIEYLYVIENLSNSEHKKALSIVQDLAVDTSNIKKKEYDNEIISFITVKEDDKNSKVLYFSFIDGNFIFSFSDLLIENSIKQIHSQNPINLDFSFKEVSATIGENSAANIYINFANISKILSPLVSTQLKSKIKDITEIANWSLLDMNFINNNIILTGFTNSPTAREKFLSIFKDQEPMVNSIVNILPIYTINYAFFGINNFSLFYENYNNFLSYKDLFDKKNEYFTEVNTKYSIKLEETFKEIFNKEILVCSLKFNFLVEDQSEFIILKVNSTAEKKLTEITEKYCKIEKLNISDYQKKIELDTDEYLQLYKLPFENLLTKLLGELYDFPQHKYYCFIGDNLIFAKEYDKLRKFAIEYFSNNLLTLTDNYMNFAKITNEKSNFAFYSNTNLAVESYKEMLNDDLLTLFKAHLDKFRKVHALGLQISYTEDLFYTHLCLHYNSKKADQNHIIWGTELDDNLAIKPKLVINHNNNTKEVFVQDKKNNIYLISPDGKILWKKQVKEPIISEIYQIDYFKNNKLQILFNTKNYIYLIDRNGDNVGSYPVKLKNEATNGLAVFDYDHSKAYRIFIACQNKAFYLLNKDGVVNTEWNFDKIQDTVTQTVQYFSLNKKDYIVFADKLNTYILNRKGERRVTITNNFPKAQNTKFFAFQKTSAKEEHFVTTTPSGKIVNIYTDGSTEEKLIQDFTYNHYFHAIDVNQDSLEDYIFVDKNMLQLFDNSGKEIANYKFENNISTATEIYKFSSENIKIGVVDAIASKVYLFNKNGTLYQDFPVKGNYSFSIGILKGTRFSLITGNDKKIVYNYQLE